MSSFVDIVTLFSAQNKRTVEQLAGFYSDTQRMQEIIHRFFADHFADEDLCGKSILLKPNWVREELKSTDYLCLRTNDNLLLCILKEVLQYRPSRVLIADAPIQGCVWDKMITPDFVSCVNELSQENGIPVVIKDFRRTVNDLENNKVEKDLHPQSDYIIFDLGEQSNLEPITSHSNNFRVTCYSPDRLAASHHKGVHKYCIARDVFESDVIITIPKLKTHRMAGMTNALKLLVGINGDKDYLPHHRVGAITEGGDNYKNKSLLRTISNLVTDEGNRRRGTRVGRLFEKVGSGFWRLSRPDSATLVNAGWYGNDTIWRTVLDINVIALFGDKNGGLHNEQQRKLYSIMDGVIGGQGDGPLHPYPSPLGVLAMSDNPYLMDVVAGELYHLNSERIPLLKNARKYLDNYTISINSSQCQLSDVRSYGIDIEMSPGWINYNI